MAIRPKDAMMVIRITRQDRETVKRMASDAGVSLSEFVMAKVWGEVFSEQPKSEKPKTSQVRCHICKGSRGGTLGDSQEWADCPYCDGTGKEGV